MSFAYQHLPILVESLERAYDALAAMLVKFIQEDLELSISNVGPPVIHPLVWGEKNGSLWGEEWGYYT